jgi:osmotically-inducible protein OsmY
MIRSKSFYLISAGLVSLALQGCEPVMVLGTGAAVTTSAAEERGIGGVISDSSIKTRISMNYMQHNSALVNNIDVVVRQGRVLLTGVVASPQMQIDAVRLAWKVDGVQEVIDETTVGSTGGFKGYASDSWVTTQVKSKILFENDVRSLNYNVQTIKGTVYLMGIAQSQEELNKVINLTRKTSKVKHVVSYVRLKPQTISSPQTTQASKASTPQKEIEIQPVDNQPASFDDKVSAEPLNPVESESPSVQEQTLDAPNSGSAFN